MLTCSGAPCASVHRTSLSQIDARRALQWYARSMWLTDGLKSSCHLHSVEVLISNPNSWKVEYAKSPLVYRADDGSPGATAVMQRSGTMATADAGLHLLRQIPCRVTAEDAVKASVNRHRNTSTCAHRLPRLARPLAAPYHRATPTQNAPMKRCPAGIALT